jgi:hypothetical protein
MRPTIAILVAIFTLSSTADLHSQVLAGPALQYKMTRHH